MNLSVNYFQKTSIKRLHRLTVYSNLRNFVFNIGTYVYKKTPTYTLTHTHTHTILSKTRKNEKLQTSRLQKVVMQQLRDMKLAIVLNDTTIALVILEKYNLRLLYNLHPTCRLVQRTEYVPRLQKNPAAHKVLG